VELVAKLV